MSEDTKPPLWQVMRELADAGHERAAELREKADAFEAAGDKWERTGEGLKPMLGAWARARRVWCECTGQPLV